MKTVINLFNFNLGQQKKEHRNLKFIFSLCVVAPCWLMLTTIKALKSTNYHNNAGAARENMPQIHRTTKTAPLNLLSIILVTTDLSHRNLIGGQSFCKRFPIQDLICCVCMENRPYFLLPHVPQGGRTRLFYLHRELETRKSGQMNTRKPG